MPVTVTFNKPVTGFILSDLTVINGTVSGLATSDNITYNFMLTPGTDGLVTVGLAEGQVTDAAGNTNIAAAGLNLQYDATAPGVTITTSATSPVNKAFPVTVRFSEEVTGFDATDVRVTNGVISGFSTVDAMNYTLAVTPAVNGVVTVDVPGGIAADAAGNPNTAAATLSCTFDVTRPGATISTTAVSPVNTAFTATVTFTESVTGFTLSGIMADNAALSSLTTSDNRIYTFLVTPASDGDVRINVPADAGRDAAGNGNTPATELRIRFTASKPAVTIADGGVVYVNAPFQLSIQFSTAVTGFDVTDIRATNATLSNLSTTDNISYQVTVTPVTDGPLTVNVPANGANDMAGNGNTASNTVSRTYDATRPSVTLQVGQATGSNYTVTATYSESVTGLTASGISVTNGVVSAVQHTGGSTWTFVLTALAEGNASVRIQAGAAVDAAGNTNTESAEATVFHSNGAPAVTVTSAAAGTVNNAFPVVFTFSKPVNGFAAGDVEITNGTLQNLTASGDRNYTANIIPARDGEVRLFVRAGAATDGGGYGNTVSNTLIRQYDGSRPGVAVTTTAVSPVNGAFTVQIRFTEKVNGFTANWLQLRNATSNPVTTTDNILFTATIRPTGGIIEVSVKENAATDAAGNGNTPSNMLTMAHDDGMPVAMLTGRNNPYAFGPFTLTIRLNEASPDFSAAAIRLENGLLTNFRKVSETQYTATVAPQFAGPVLKITIPANQYSDMAGNRNLASNTLQYETLQSYTIENLYPNPTTGSFVIKFGGTIYEKMKIQLVSMNGDVVHKVEVAPNTNEVRIDIPASVPDGVYHLMIVNGPVKRKNIILLRP